MVLELYNERYLAHYGVIGMKWGRRHRHHLIGAARNEKQRTAYDDMIRRSSDKKETAQVRSFVNNDPEKMKRYFDERSRHIKYLRTEKKRLDDVWNQSFSNLSEKDLAKGRMYLQREEKIRRKKHG